MVLDCACRSDVLHIYAGFPGEAPTCSVWPITKENGMPWFYWFRPFPYPKEFGPVPDSGRLYHCQDMVLKRRTRCFKSSLRSTVTDPALHLPPSSIIGSRKYSQGPDSIWFMFVLKQQAILIARQSEKWLNHEVPGSEDQVTLSVWCVVYRSLFYFLEFPSFILCSRTDDPYG